MPGRRLLHLCPGLIVWLSSTQPCSPNQTRLNEETRSMFPRLQHPLLHLPLKTHLVHLALTLWQQGIRLRLFLRLIVRLSSIQLRVR